MSRFLAVVLMFVLGCVSFVRATPPSAQGNNGVLQEEMQDPEKKKFDKPNKMYKEHVQREKEIAEATADVKAALGKKDKKTVAGILSKLAESDPKALKAVLKGLDKKELKAILSDPDIKLTKGAKNAVVLALNDAKNDEGGVAQPVPTNMSPEPAPAVLTTTQE